MSRACRPHVLIATVSRTLVWMLAPAVLHSNAAISSAAGRAGRLPLPLLLVWTLQTAEMVFNSVRIMSSSMQHGLFYPEVRSTLHSEFLCISYYSHCSHFCGAFVGANSSAAFLWNFCIRLHHPAAHAHV